MTETKTPFNFEKLLVSGDEDAALFAGKLLVAVGHIQALKDPASDFDAFIGQLKSLRDAVSGIVDAAETLKAKKS